ncbi:MAG: STAS domain-containing protein [Acidobacteria bacterium]|nr:STAS domain-containing protein [Acidobacteriota bacterium]
MFTISQRQTSGISILDLQGKITLGDGSAQFREAIRRLIEEGRMKLLLNFAEVSYVDSSGIGELVSAYTTVTSKGGQLRLVNLPRRIHDLLRITKLLTVLETFDDESRAVQSFSQG